MNLFYLYAHPNPQSLNGSLKQKALDLFALKKIPVQLSDLYAENFNAVASWQDFESQAAIAEQQYFMAQKKAAETHQFTKDIANEQKKLLWANHIIFQFPLWWFSTPAILKGWLDRVIAKGFAYDTGKIFTDGLLQGKTASLSITTQSPASAYQTTGVHGESLDAFIKPLQHALKFTGIQMKPAFVAFDAFNIPVARQQEIIRDYQRYLESLLENLG